jgi:hypothetical protein
MGGACWQVSYDIVEFEQGGKVRAAYRKALLANLSRDLKLRHGKGFHRNNLVYMREAENMQHLLQERRTALISAAVTGKIDVRELAESEAA